MGRWASAVLGLAMGLSNVLSYVFVALLSSALGPEDFGGFAALNTFGVLCALPAGAFQLVVARRQGAAALRAGDHSDGVRVALAVGAALSAAVLVASPWIAPAFHLDTAWAVVWVATTIPPMTITGCQQGVLLGRDRLGRLAVLYLVTAASRVTAAIVAVALDLEVHEVFAATCVGSVVTMLVGMLLVSGVALPGSAATARSVLAELVRSNAALAALMALSSVDVILARHYLSQADSGGYALAALFGRVVFWGTQFVALSVVPVVADAREGSRRTVHAAGGVVLVLGTLVALVCATVPGLLVRMTGGAGYEHAEGLLAWFALVGTGWALGQLWLFSDLGGGTQGIGAVAAVAAAVEVTLVVLVWHDSAREILAVTGGCALVVAVVGAIRVPHGSVVPGPTSPETAEAMHATTD